MVKIDEDWGKYYDQLILQYREDFTLAWDMIKFYSLLCSSLITLTLTALGLILSAESYDPLRARYFFFILCLFPVLILNIVNYGRKNFLRACKRIYAVLAITIKIEELFGFRLEKRGPDRESFPNDDYYVPEGWRNIVDRDGQIVLTDKDFIDDLIHEDRKSFYTDSVRIFNIFENIALLLLIFLTGIIFLKI